MLRIIKVAGSSLIPRIKPGDFVLVLKVPWFFRLIQKGDMVVFNHGTYGRMIKIVDSVDMKNGKLIVSGTNPESMASRAIGTVDNKDLLGKVIWHIPREE